jgi:hypothetical protein
MLFLLQAAAQHPPPTLVPINITVQQPPGGMPDWAKIAIGAILAIGGGLAVEYIKPAIAKHRALKSVKKQLRAEVENDMAAILECITALDGMPRDTGEQRQNAYMWGVAFLNGRMPLPDDRYTYYFDRQKEIVYEIDPDGILGTFYSNTKGFVTHINVSSFDEARIRGEFAIKAALDFLEGKEPKP